MDHYEGLNLLLANACPKEIIDAGDGDYYKVFELDLHCDIAKVTAEVISTVGTIQFRIVSMEII